MISKLAGRTKTPFRHRTYQNFGIDLVVGIVAHLEIQTENAFELEKIRVAARLPGFGGQLEQAAPQLRSFVETANQH